VSAVLAHRALTAEVNPWELSEPMRCEFEHDKGEPSIFWPTDLAHPGSPPSVQLLSCRIGGVEVIDMLSSGQRERIEEAILDQLEN
jgi:hypothetical protein